MFVVAQSYVLFVWMAVSEVSELVGVLNEIGGDTAS
jgi:hypothetical protein